MMIEDNNPLGKERVGKLFFRLAIPVVIAQLVNLLYNLVDRIFIGHIEGVGDIALTGVGICFPLIMIISAVSCLCGMGGAPKAAIKMGENDLEGANKILGNCVTLTVISSLILTIIVLIFKEPILYLFGASDNTIIYSLDYISIYSLGTIFVMVSLGLSAFITTQGFSKISMVNVIIGAFINIVLDPIFIYSFNMGVKGAALATVISQAIVAFLIIRFLLSSKTKLKIKIENLKLDYKVFLPVMALGLAPFIMQSTESILAICFNTSLYKYGGDIAVGAMTILTSLMQLAMLPLQGFSQGAQPIISYNYGAKNPKRIKDVFRLLFIICVAYSFLFWLMCMVFPSALISLFTDKVELITFAIPSLSPATLFKRLGLAVFMSAPTALTQSSTTPSKTSVSLFCGISC